MKHIITLFCILLTTLTGLAQKRTCLSELDMRALRTKDPARYQRHMELENFTARFMQGNAAERLVDNNGLIVIPVVVHVLHQGEAVGTGRNISVAQIQSQIDVLNEDFRRTNADRTNTPAAFTGVAADLNIEFRLACQDPNGNATNGILRRQTNRASYTIVQNTNGTINETSTGIKFTANGGQDAWPTNRYLNIWVCTLNGGVLGYATFPADYAANPNVDGVVVTTTAMGRTGNVAAPFNRGRTATHEVGHWLNLRHIWGDANCGDDFVGDTPTQQTFSLNGVCPTFPRRTCGNTTNGDMFMNYMDYTDDACMNIYTAGQRTRARAVFAAGGPRAAFIDNYYRIQPPPVTCLPADATISLTNPNCLATTWSIVSGSATILNATNSGCTLRSTIGNNVTLRATAGNYVSDVTVIFGVTISSSITGCSNGFQQWQLSANSPSAGSNWAWSVASLGTNSQIIIGSPNSPSTNVSVRGGGTVRLNYNACGVARQDGITVFSNCPQFRLAVSPNPASGSMQVSFGSMADGKMAEATAPVSPLRRFASTGKTILTLFDVNTQQQVKQWQYTETSTPLYRLPLGRIAKGVYLLQADRNGETQVTRVIVQ